MTFRQIYRQDLGMRVIDMWLHIIAACMTGSLWQWGPDIMLVMIWPWSMITNRRLPDDSVLLRIHKALHSIIIVCLLGVVSVWWRPVRILAVNWLLHFIIDVFTHRERSRI